MPEATLPTAWHLHLCRHVAHWRGGQFARAHAEFLRLLAQAGRTPQPVFVTIWTDELSYESTVGWAKHAQPNVHRAKVGRKACSLDKCLQGTAPVKDIYAPP